MATSTQIKDVFIESCKASDELKDEYLKTYNKLKIASGFSTTKLLDMIKIRLNFKEMDLMQILNDLANLNLSISGLAKDQSRFFELVVRNSILSENDRTNIENNLSSMLSRSVNLSKVTDSAYKAIEKEFPNFKVI
jgi:hypothetical protein